MAAPTVLLACVAYAPWLACDSALFSAALQLSLSRVRSPDTNGVAGRALERLCAVGGEQLARTGA